MRWYDSVPNVTQLSDLTVKMLGTAADPCLTPNIVSQIYMSVEVIKKQLEKQTETQNP